MPVPSFPIFLLVPNCTGFEESPRTHGEARLPFPGGEYLVLCPFCHLAGKKNLGLPGRRGMAIGEAVDFPVEAVL